jgi:hypothetical protein
MRQHAPSVASGLTYTPAGLPGAAAIDNEAGVHLGLQWPEINSLVNMTYDTGEKPAPGTGLTWSPAGFPSAQANRVEGPGSLGALHPVYQYSDPFSDVIGPAVNMTYDAVDRKEVPPGSPVEHPRVCMTTDALGGYAPLRYDDSRGPGLFGATGPSGPQGGEAEIASDHSSLATYSYDHSPPGRSDWEAWSEEIRLRGRLGD